MECYTFQSSDYVSNPSSTDSKLDRLIKGKWHQAMENGQIEFTIDHRVLDGQLKFVSSFLPGRAPGKRRMPDSMTSLVMPFDHNKFNFTKVKPEEILFKLSHSSTCSPVATVLINKSPIENCSSLLVPSLEDCLPQVTYSVYF